MTKKPEGVRYSISEAAKLLDRSPHTLRSWDRNEAMPKRLRPQRDEHGNRYWTPELIEQIKAWIAKTGFHPGRGISYHPSPERLQAHIDKIRKSSRRAHPGEKTEALKAMIDEAITQLGLSEDEIITSLPNVAAGQGIPLDEALRAAAEVIAIRHR